jgi:hypothetical protein
MARKTYLEAVNDALIYLREPTVTAVTDTPYSKLIGRFVNQTIREISDSYEWNCLTDTLTATTADNIFSYVLEGSGSRFRIIDVLNDTENVVMKYAPTEMLNQWFLLTDPQKGSPLYYNPNGQDDNGDTLFDFYPIPDGVYNLRINLYLSHPELVNNSDKIKIPYDPVVLGTVAKAMQERGETGGINSSEMQMMYKSSLSDHIAIECNNFPEETIWYGQ